MRSSKSIDGVSVVIGIIGDATKTNAGGGTMNLISRWVGAMALLVASIAANAQTVTYAFTGVVTSSTNAAIPVQAYVTGTYTFNYNSSDQIIGRLPGPPTIGAWAIGSTGVPYNPVFSSTVRVGAFTYSSSGTAPPSDPDDSSVVTGNGFSTLSASEATPAFDTGSFFTIVENNGNLRAPYSDTGHPVTLTASRSGFGDHVVNSCARADPDRSPCHSADQCHRCGARRQTCRPGRTCTDRLRGKRHTGDLPRTCKTSAGSAGQRRKEWK
jgi:hypothetical protein